jgi:3-methyladenine DNA glycosylase AlkD
LTQVFTADDVKAQLARFADPQRAAHSQKYFKTAAGEYGEGDRFIGLTVPNGRKVAKEFRWLELAEINELLQSPIHEHRLCALHILVLQFQAAVKRNQLETQREIYDLYMAALEAKAINNWDLVDTSAPYIVSGYLFDKDRSRLYELTKDERLWHRRTGILGSFGFIARGDASTSLELCAMVLDDKRDLIHKAAGWMLREVGKRVSVELLREFLARHVHEMPRTMLRYAIEHLPEAERQKWLKA